MYAQNADIRKSGQNSAKAAKSANGKIGNNEPASAPQDTLQKQWLAVFRQQRII
jgi:hypothetical protein